MEPVKEDKKYNEQDSKYYYENISKQIEREDGLVNTRMTWMLTIHAFLFAALAIMASKDNNQKIVDLLKIVLPGTGFILSITGFVGILGANIAIDDLKNEWKTKKGEMAIKVPTPYGRTLAFWLGLLPSIFIPLFLGGIWAYIFFKL